MKKILCLAAFAVALASTPAVAEDDPDFLSFRAGAFDVNDTETTAMLGVEYRSDFKKFYIAPMVGGFVTAEGSVYGYGGLYIDVFLGRRVVLRPSFSVGAYGDGNGKDLGGVLEFRSAIALAWRFDDRSRLGLEFSHLSNAGIYDNNPGTENLTLNYSVPLDQLF